MTGGFAFALIRNPDVPDLLPVVPKPRARLKIVPETEGPDAATAARLLEELRIIRSLVCHDLTVNRFAELTAQSPQTVRRKIRDRAWLTGRIPVFGMEEGVGWRCRWEDYLEWRAGSGR